MSSDLANAVVTSGQVNGLYVGVLITVGVAVVMGVCLGIASISKKNK